MPVPVRDQSRLLILDRKWQRIKHSTFAALPDYLQPNDLIVFNDTRVLPARLYAEAESGKRIELLLLGPCVSPHGNTCRRWKTLVKGRVRSGMSLIFQEGVVGHLVGESRGGEWEIVFDLPQGVDLYPYIEQWGAIPLPPYILKKREVSPSDKIRYQTVYADIPGSVAAPTAGLHFTKELIEAIKRRGIQTATITLHIGLDTFQPIRTDSIVEHAMHRERFHLSEETAEKVNFTLRNGGRVVAVGTTVTRTLESVANSDGTVRPCSGETDLFITPGFTFKVVNVMVTNFHSPRSTLLVMVSAFSGYELIRSAYREAIRQKYRFLSFGDAMLIL